MKKNAKLTKTNSASIFFLLSFSLTTWEYSLVPVGGSVVDAGCRIIFKKEKIVQYVIFFFFWKEEK